MPADLGMCLGCSVKKAVSKNGTVPLCADCNRVATKGTNPRGVKMSEPKKPKKLSAVR